MFPIRSNPVEAVTKALATFAKVKDDLSNAVAGCSEMVNGNLKEVDERRKEFEQFEQEIGAENSKIEASRDTAYRALAGINSLLGE
jgi:hypothetical protein